MQECPSSSATAMNLADNLLKLNTHAVLLMNGEMGSGKTTFTQMLGKALGLTQKITSPTFVGVHEYHINKGSQALQFFHCDIYQVALSYYDIKEFLRREPESKKIIVIEWAEKLGNEVLEQLSEEQLKIYNLDFSVIGEEHQVRISL